jgi:hypothetical protein
LRAGASQWALVLFLQLLCLSLPRRLNAPVWLVVRECTEDLISAVQFDGTGDYLATGDRGGRVVIFESSDVTARQASKEAREGNGDHSGDSEMHSPSKEIEYRFYCEFQSHEPEFDYLKSLEIEEKINRIRWRHGKAGPLFLLSTNGECTQPPTSPPPPTHTRPPAPCVGFSNMARQHAGTACTAGHPHRSYG